MATTGGFMPNLTGGAAGPTGSSLGNTTNENGGGLTIIKSNPMVTVALIVAGLVILYLLFFRKAKKR